MLGHYSTQVYMYMYVGFLDDYNMQQEKRRSRQNYTFPHLHVLQWNLDIMNSYNL